MQGENHLSSVSPSAFHFWVLITHHGAAVGTVGTTSSGAVDDLQEVGSVRTSYLSASVLSRY